jgi:hypothetical protein
MQPDKFRNRQRVEFKPKKGAYEIWTIITKKSFYLII